MTFNPDAATVYASGPTSDPYEPSKEQIRALLKQYETVMDAFTTNAGLIYTTMAAMNAAATTFTDPRSAWQFEAGSEGIYVLNPTTDTWTKVGRLPYSWVPGTDLGAGTANAIQITTDTPVADGMVVMFQLFEATTASPVTVSINGGAALTLKTNRGSNANALTADMEIWGRYRASDSTLRMLNDQDVSALVAQAEAARDEAVTLVGLANTALQPGDSAAELVYTPPFTGAAPSILSDWLARGAYPSDFGAVGDGVATDTTPITRWLEALAGDGIPGYGNAGTFMVDPISLTIDGDVVIRGAPGLSIKGVPSSTFPIIKFDGLTARPRVDIQGFTIDNSAMPFVPAVQSGTGLSLVRVDGFSIRNMNFLGGASLTDLETGFGDSGITTVECGSGEITGNRFTKQPDLGVYISGGASTGDTDDYGDIIVSKNVFTYCNAGISAKRQSRRLIATDNVITQGRVGISLFEASSIDPGREAIITGNAIHKMGSRAIDLRGSIGDVVNGNQIVDWGYKLDGTTADAGKDAAIVLRGVERATIGDNTVVFRSWANANHTAIRMAEFTMQDTTVKQTRRNILIGNNLFQMTTAIDEQNSTTENYGDNYISATTPATLATGSLSIYKHTQTNGLSRKQGNGTLERFNLLGAVEGKIITFERAGTEYGNVSSDAGGYAFLTGGIRVPTFTVAGLPSAVGRERQIVYVSNETGGATIAFSDNVNWRRVQDRAIVS